ncbi:MAG: hypothetical protein H6982_14210 [Chromatiales bacterium]|nr:hypothetical protein [Chromatiales bacterium]
MRETETGAALEALEQRTGLSTRLWSRAFAGLTAVTFRERGEEAVHRLWYDVLCGHQVGHYREGLAKLGIGDDPPAVAAAKYHYFTNLIGGLDMEYVEESPRKVWIRYLAPMWTYEGVAMMAMPGRLRRTIFSAWHPRNGELMGCPRLGYVGTKFIMEGDPYDEGYFIEHDRDLAPSEVMRFEHAEHTPEFDPARAPRLDPALWPPARLARARRNFSAGYVRTTVEMLLRSHGAETTWHIVRQTARMLGVQLAHDLANRVGVERHDLPGAAHLLASVLDACEQRHRVEELGPTTWRFVLESYRPFADDAPPGLREAWFHLPAMLVRVLNGRLRLSREPLGPTAEAWVLEDAGRWLY